MVEIKNLKEITLEEINAFGSTLYTSELKYEISCRKSGDQINFIMDLVKNPEEYIKYIEDDMVTMADYDMMNVHGYSLGAYYDGELIGFLIAEERTWNNSVWIEMIRVADDYKGKGIGSSMLSALESFAKVCCNRIIEIETQNTNVPAINFYKKNGYEFSGLNMTLYDPVEVGDEIAVFMSKGIR